MPIDFHSRLLSSIPQVAVATAKTEDERDSQGFAMYKEEDSLRRARRRHCQPTSGIFGVQSLSHMVNQELPTAPCRFARLYMLVSKGG